MGEDLLLKLKQNNNNNAYNNNNNPQQQQLINNKNKNNNLLFIPGQYIDGNIILRRLGEREQDEQHMLMSNFNLTALQSIVSSSSLEKLDNDDDDNKNIVVCEKQDEK